MDSNSGILSENTKANYTERYDSLLKMKNHVNVYLLPYFAIFRVCLRVLVQLVKKSI